jgi:hypothetical protein
MLGSDLFMYLLHYTVARTVYDWLFDSHGVLLAGWQLLLGAVVLLGVLPFMFRWLVTGTPWREEQRGYRWQRGRDRARRDNREHHS